MPAFLRPYQVRVALQAWLLGRSALLDAVTIVLSFIVAGLLGVVIAGMVL